MEYTLYLRVLFNCSCATAGALEARSTGPVSCCCGLLLAGWGGGGGGGQTGRVVHSAALHTHSPNNGGTVIGNTTQQYNVL
jgi:hypothetical protein